MRNRLPWTLATAQVMIAGGLLYWDHIEYERVLRASGALSLWDYWSWASGLLLILDFPAVVLAMPLFLVLRDHALLMDAAFLCIVFLLWAWIGFSFRRRERSSGGLKKSAYVVGCVLTGAFGLIMLKSLSVTSTLKILIVVFWSVLGLIGLCRSLQRIQRTGTSQPIDQ